MKKIIIELISFDEDFTESNVKLVLNGVFHDEYLINIEDVDETQLKSCDDCLYCEKKDYGYSDYTTEGTDVKCEHGLNPYFPTDRFYGKKSAFFFAEKCEQFCKGEGRHYSVEGNLK